MKRNYTLYTCLLVIIYSLVLSGCTSKHVSEKDIIFVSIAPQRYFVQAITKDDFRIYTMIGPGENPETYDPSPTQMVQLAQAKAYFRIGYIPFETSWMHRIQKNTPTLPIYDMSTGIVPLEAHQSEEDTHHHNIDPHIWFSCKNAQKIARYTVDALCQLVPEKKALYTRRYDSLNNEIVRIDRLIQKQVAQLPQAYKQFLIYHPALSYYAEEYGLHQIEIAHLGKNPTPSQLQSVIDTGKANDIRVILVQEEFDKRQAKSIANMLNASVHTIYPLSENWSYSMLHVVHCLQKAALSNSQTKEEKKNE